MLYITPNFTLTMTTMMMIMTTTTDKTDVSRTHNVNRVDTYYNATNYVWTFHVPYLFPPSPFSEAERRLFT